MHGAALLLLLSSALALPAETPPAAPPCRPQTGSVILAFNDAPFLEALDSLSRLTCRRFILTEDVKEKGPWTVTVKDAKPMTASDAAAALVAALEQSGLELVPVGGPYWRVRDKNRVLLANMICAAPQN